MTNWATRSLINMKNRTHIRDWERWPYNRVQILISTSFIRCYQFNLRTYVKLYWPPVHEKESLLARSSLSLCILCAITRHHPVVVVVVSLVLHMCVGGCNSNVTANICTLCATRAVFNGQHNIIIHRLLTDCDWAHQSLWHLLYSTNIAHDNDDQPADPITR